jgi:two-component system capsular synthesis response regulator RcsB
LSDFSDQNLRILLAGDHPIFRMGLQTVAEELPEALVVAQALTADERLQLLHQHSPDLLITDLLMPADQHATDLQLLADIRKEFPELRILVVTSVQDGQLLRSILRLKVQGLMNKTQVLIELPAAIASIRRERPYIANSVRNAMLEALQLEKARPKTLEQLSPREREVLKLFATGASVSNIAEQLNRSKQTVSAQKISAMRKLRLTTDVALLIYLQKKAKA